MQAQCMLYYALGVMPPATNLPPFRAARERSYDAEGEPESRLVNAERTDMKQSTPELNTRTPRPRWMRLEGAARDGPRPLCMYADTDATQEGTN